MQNLSDYLKKFPHQGGIIVCEEKKFIYMKACKTAGTSISKVLLPHARLIDKISSYYPSKILIKIINFILN